MFVALQKTFFFSAQCHVTRQNIVIMTNCMNILTLLVYLQSIEFIWVTSISLIRVVLMMEYVKTMLGVLVTALLLRVASFSPIQVTKSFQINALTIIKAHRIDFFEGCGDVYYKLYSKSFVSLVIVIDTYLWHQHHEYMTLYIFSLFKLF